MKYIKAKRCYICGQLFDIEDGGYIIARKYIKDINFKDLKKELNICRLCTDKMVVYIMDERIKESEGNT